MQAIATFLLDNEAVAEGVKVNLLESVSLNGLKSWRGTFRYSGTNLLGAGDYDIEFEDERRGVVVITQHVLSGTGSHGTFVGSGPLE